MEEKKLSTQEILAKIRAQKAGGAAPPAETVGQNGGEEKPPAAEAAPAEPAPAAAAPAASAEKPETAPPAKPGSTKDILAAIRKQGAAGGGTAQPEAAAAAPAPATPAATPSSTKDILAAIRAQKAGGAAAPQAAAATTEAPAKKPTKTAAAPAGERPSVQEMLKAVREGKKPEEAAPATAAPPKVAPPMPTKPTAKPAKGAPAAGRRNFLWTLFTSPFALAWTALAATTGVSLLATARFMFPNVLVEPPSKFKVGPPSDFPLNAVSTRFTSQYGVWIVHTDQYDGRDLIYALASVCTHLGCTPSWLDGEQKFKCPCHGSGFYITGINFEGPAPRPLERVGLRVAEDGMLEVDKSVKFQEEMGQWLDPNSFVEMA